MAEWIDCLLEVLDISSNITLYWGNVSRKNMSLNQLSDLLCNLNTWMNKNIVCSVWFPIRRIHLEVHLAVPSKLAIVFSFMQSITLDIFQILSLASKHCILLFPAVFVLGDAGVHVHTLNSGDVASYTLKHLLIKLLALLLLWSSYISSQTIAISDLGEALIIWGFNAVDILLKIWLTLRIGSTMLELIGMLLDLQS